MIDFPGTMDRSGPRPIYEQLAALIGQELRDLHAPGDRLPSEDALVARFGVNRHTLRHAVDLLVADGLIERRRGLGTFVVQRPLEYLLHREARFSETLAGLGRDHGTRVLRRSTVAADALVADRLGLVAGDTVFRLDTMRSVDDQPLSLITHWLPSASFPDLASAYTAGSLHALLAERYAVRLRRAQTVVTAILPDDADAQALRIHRRLPLLRLSTVNVDIDHGAPREFAVSRIRADRMELTIDHEIP